MSPLHDVRLKSANSAMTRTIWIQNESLLLMCMVLMVLEVILVFLGVVLVVLEVILVVLKV